MAILNNSNAISSGGYDINNSLRFRSSASAYLSRTPSSATNRTTWTWSSWVKRGALSGGTQFGRIMSTQGAAGVGVNFMSDDTLRLSFGGSSTLQTTQVFRDPSAWYHVVVALDTTQATAANRVKLYINGTQVTAFSSATYPSLNDTFGWNNSSIVHQIGASTGDGATAYFDGYQADINAVDGQALTPSSFGETDTTTGVWKPKAYTSTYGTNGFYLKFSDIATTSGSNAGLGKDFSGNTNYWTTNNISVTAGTTYDAMIDSPTLTSATVANYAVMNPLKLGASQTLTQANLNVSGSGWGTTSSTLSVTTGKWYWEITSINSAGTASNPSFMIGVSTDTSNNQSSYNATGVYHMQDNGDRYYNNTTDTRISGVSIVTNDVVMLAYDADAGKLWIGKNGTWFNSGSPTGGTGQIYSSIPTTGVTPTAAASGAGAYNANFGQRPFSYTPPTGFVRLNTYNLPDSTIKKGNTVMDATLYTGTGASLSVTNAGAFKPDFVWVKGRSGATDHAWYDSVRGTTKQIESNTTTAETTEAQGLTAFGTSGFTVGTLAQMNTSAATYVGWQWQAGQGSTSSNTSGSITSTVSVNTTAGFSVVTYTGTGANATVGHGLGVAPRFIIVKQRGTSGGGDGNWLVGSTAGIGWTGRLILNGTFANEVNSTHWNNTAPTSTVFSLGTSGNVNGNTGSYVAYCFAAISGYSAFDSYTGNGSADGPFVYTGFRPKYLLIKVTSAVEDWMIFDSARGPYNANAIFLRADTADTGGSDVPVDFLSNGFKLRSTALATNSSGNAYIYMAFAENPFKNALAR
jgi:hypothetical protein